MGGVSTSQQNRMQLYHGNQDNGSFGTTDAGVAIPVWSNERCCDGFDVSGDNIQALTTICCFSPPPATRLFRSTPGLNPPTTEIAGPPGTLRQWQQLPSIANFGVNRYIVLTSSGVYATTNANAATPTWSAVGTGMPTDACGIQLSRPTSKLRPGRPSKGILLFVKRGGCSGDVGASIWRHSGTGTTGAWVQVPNTAQVGVFAVDPSLTTHIIASHLEPAGPVMRMTTDGGATWDALPQLDALMTGGGVFRYRTTQGPSAFTGFFGYPQPSVVAIDPRDGYNIVAGAVDAGLFLSRNGGSTWHLLSNPLNPSDGDPHIPRPRYVNFDNNANGLTLYVGTQGRGVWRIPIGCNFSTYFCGRIDLGKFEWRAICRPMCPPWWEILIDPFDPAWRLTVVDKKGEVVPYRLTKNKNGVSVVIKPAEKEMSSEAAEKYSLIYETVGTKKSKEKSPFSVKIKSGKTVKTIL